MSDSLVQLTVPHGVAPAAFHVAVLSLAASMVASGVVIAMYEQSQQDLMEDEDENEVWH